VEYRRLDRTNLNVSVVGLGALFLDRAESDAALFEMIKKAVDSGINIIQCPHESVHMKDL